MSDTIEPMPTNGVKRQTGERQDRQDLAALAAELVERAKTEGVELIGPGGLLTGLTKKALETALDVELTEHLGYEKHDAAGRGSGNSRNGTRGKRVLTELGPVEVDVPRDLAGTFEPVIVKKGQRRLDGIDQIVLSLTARGLTTGEVAWTAGFCTRYLRRTAAFSADISVACTRRMRAALSGRGASTRTRACNPGTQAVGRLHAVTALPMMREDDDGAPGDLASAVQQMGRQQVSL